MNRIYLTLLTALFLVILTQDCLAGDKIKKLKFPSEPLDPDSYDLSVWDKTEPGIHSGFGSTDLACPRSVPPVGDISESIKLQGWKGERVHCLLLVWSKEATKNIRIKTDGFINGDFKIGERNISASVVKYVLTDQFLNEKSGSCGPRDNEKVPVHLSPDLLSNENSFKFKNQGTKPVWISIDIPPDAPAGIYTGEIKRSSKSGSVTHALALEVLNKELPPPSEWEFHLDLWQNPFAVARYHDVELWSKEHFNLLRPYLEMLARAGQKCITTTLIDRPWGFEKPCFDDFRSMIKWTRKKDGTWEYDYTIFDLYVHLAMECGIKKQINCYTMVPIENNFTWFDEKSSETVIQKLFPGTREYEDHWRPFLMDFRKHLQTKGWLQMTTIALDERGEEEMAHMFGFLEEAAPELKITMAGFYHESINMSIYDFSSNWRDYGRIPTEAVKSRKDAGLITTYYVACGIPKPNNFTFSPPSESCYEGWMAAAMGFDGFLRWAYNSWPENPLTDSRYTKWPAGDTYFIYPGPLSSVRFEKLREGIQDYEKISILRDELMHNPSPDAAYRKKNLDEFLESIDSKTLENRTAAEVISEGKKLLYELVKDNSESYKK